MTKRELIYTVFEKLNIQSDDTDITEELVSSLLDTKRAMLLKQQYSKNSWHLPIEVKQELCLSLTLVDKVNGYSCAGKILSTVQLPRSIKIRGKEGPLMARKSDGSEIAMSIVPIERLPFLFNNRYTQHLTYCVEDFNGKLLIVSNDDKIKFLKFIKVTDIFEQPDLAYPMTCDYDANVDVWDAHYPIESAMADTAIGMVVQELTKSLGIPKDDINDATDDRR